MRASNDSSGWRSGRARPEAGVTTWLGIVPTTSAARAGERRKGIGEKAARVAGDA
jgi:hypothetical protein